MFSVRSAFVILVVGIISITASTALANTAPVANCQNITVPAGIDCVAAASIDNSSYDPDGDPVTITQSPPGPYPLGTTVVTLTITDGNLSDNCQATVTIEDNSPPVVTCPPGTVRLECFEPTEPFHTGYAEATDNCDPAPVITYEDTDGINLPGNPLVRTIWRQWIATDASGNVGDCVQPILIYDNLPPYFTLCPEDIIISCGEDTDPAHTGQAVGEDACNPDPDLWFVDELLAGDCPFESVINRTWHLNDDTGSDDVTCLQVITIADVIPPSVTCPDPITVECITLVPAPDLELLTYSDNCDPEPVAEFVGDDQTGVCPIIITRTYQVTDVCGNSATCEQTITVEDLTDPIITAGPPPLAYECTAEIPTPNPALISATDNCDDNLLIEHVGDLSNNQTCPEIITRTYRVADDCDNYVIFEQLFTINDLTPPVCVMPASQTIFQCEPETICLALDITDNCTSAPQLVVTNGPGEIVDGQWCYTPTGSASFDVTIRATDQCGHLCEGTFSLDIIINTPPAFNNCPDELLTIHWGDHLLLDLSATDIDNQLLSYSLCEDALQGATINPSTGWFAWATNGGNICDPSVCVIVTDECGASTVCEFEVCVRNDPPTITCPGDQTICFGGSFETVVTAINPDGGQLPTFSLLDGPAGVMVDINTGVVSWPNPERGTWEICVIATDRAATCDPCSPANADTCCFALDVVSLDLAIETIDKQIQGQYADVSILFPYQGTNRPIAGLDLLIQYDASALSFATAYEGEFFEDCEWEYFTYRFGVNGNCGLGTCPTGIVRLILLANTNGGDITQHPDCYSNDGLALPGPNSSTASKLAVLKFMVSNDRTLECQFAPIKFIWYGCDDNTMSTLGGDTLYISNMVYELESMEGDPPIPVWREVTGQDNTFPTVTGALQPECLQDDKTSTYDCANFYQGGIRIVCGDEIDAVGDINLNGLGYEIADAVMLTNYFLEGLAAFGDHADGSIAASDTNRDGVTLSVADLVYLIRVVIGDAQPYAKRLPAQAKQTGYSIQDGVIAVDGNLQISGACLNVKGELTPTLLAPGMDLRYSFDGTNTRILITPSLTASSIGSFHGEFLAGITGQLISLDLATADGTIVHGKNLPSRYHLGQNYPNPFNPTTRIAFNLPTESQVRLEVFNATGQRVALLVDRQMAPGRHVTMWNASEQASGVYLYRLTTDMITLSRKMLLLK